MSVAMCDRCVRTLAFALALLPATAALAAMPSHPTLKLATLDGKPYDLASQRGRWVIVNFWATWCVPCVKEMPAMDRYVKAHKDKVSAIGVAYDDTPAPDLRAFLRQHAVSYPVAQATLDKPPKDFDEPRGLPTTYVIAPDGTVAKVIVGPTDAASLAATTGIR